MLPFLGKIGPVLIPTMAVFWCLGYLVSAIVAIAFSRRQGLKMSEVLGLLIVTCTASVIGAKISAVLLLTQPEELRWFFRHPAEIVKFWTPGFSFYGVVFFIAAAGLWYILRNSLPVWRTADIFIPTISLGHAVQSIGDFLAGAHPGRPTDLPWGISIHHWTFRGLKWVPLHPVMLYIFVISFIGFVTAWAWLQARDHPEEKFFLSWMYRPVFRILKLKFIDGELYFLGGAFYAFFRYFAEFFRDPRTLIWYPNFPLPQTQVACIVFFILCWGWYFVLRAIWETEQAGLPYRGWMKFCFRLKVGLRWLAKRIPDKVKSEKCEIKSKKFKTPENIIIKQ